MAYITSGQYTPWGANSYASLGLKLSKSILYNTRLQPCWIYAPANLTATTCSASYATGAYIDLKYNFNLGADNGNLVGTTNDINANRSSIVAYDQLNRITSGGTTSSCTTGCWSLTFSPDEWANLPTVTGTGAAATASYNIQVNSSNRITTTPFTYDASGNLLTDVTSSYAWNAESQIKTADGVNYIYDGDGNRVEKSGTKLYWYGQHGEILQETDTTGSTSNAAFSEYIYFDGERVARRDYQNNVFYYFEDPVHSSRAIAEISSSGAQSLCYDGDLFPYGGEDVFTNTCPQNYKFEGKERDTETGNDYFGARYYSSTYGRFLSPDWSATPSPIPYADFTNPQSLNLYAIVRNDPESFSDLDGHCAPPYDACGLGGDDADNRPRTDGQSTQQKMTASNVASGTAQVGKDTLFGGAKGIANTFIGINNYGAQLLNAAISPLTSFQFGQVPEYKAATPGEGSAMAGIFIVSFLTPAGEEKAASSIPEVTAEAEKLYPKLAGKFQNHHIEPKYLGGAADGATARIPAAYHQLITNEFRALAPYGQQIQRTAEEVASIMKAVYSKYPLP
ncbi:MAG: RHS repeat-associated core domain-containing protein [Candidatus Acidiferrales bacterium]